MKIKIHYGNEVLCLPQAVVPLLGRADGDAVKVLLYLAAKGGTSRDKIATELAISPDTVNQAVAFWRGTGLIDTDTDGRKRAAPPAESATDATGSIRVEDSAKPIRSGANASASLPRYTTEELSALLESRRELAALIDECSHVFGKVFSTHEVSILLGIVDYLNVDGEYLLLLLAHCAKIGKKSVRYVETVAFSLYDDGVTDLATLQERLKKREQMEEQEGKIRALFGLNSRALTTKERKMIETWLFTYQYGQDVITRAYEMTVDAIGKPSIPYTNSILERWAAAQLHNLEQIEQAEASRTGRGATPTSPGNSFDTDDFFDAALKRSFGDDFQPTGKSKTSKNNKNK